MTAINFCWIILILAEIILFILILSAYTPREDKAKMVYYRHDYPILFVLSPACLCFRACLLSCLFPLPEIVMAWDYWNIFYENCFNHHKGRMAFTILLFMGLPWSSIVII